MSCDDNDPDKTGQNPPGQNRGDQNNSDPKIPEPPSGSSELYRINDTDGSSGPITDRQIRWQTPKEGYVAPPSDGERSAYETSDSQQAGGDTPSAEALRWQMPKEEFRTSSFTPESELYQTSSQDTPEETTQQARSWQVNAGEVLSDSGSGEVYGLKSGVTPSDQQPGPDLQVLFADTQCNPDDVYSIGSGSGEADSAAAGGPPPDGVPGEDAAKKQSPPSSDIYGVGAPVERFYSPEISRGRRTFEDPDEKYADPVGRAEYEGALSVETLYERRKNQERQRMFFDDVSSDDETVEPRHPERPKLPSYPFFRGILRPFLSPSFVLRISMLAFAALVPFYPGIWHFSRHSDDMAEVFAQSASQANVPISHWEQLFQLPTINRFLGILFDDRLLLFFVSLVWGVFAVPYLLQVFTVTAAGDDRIEEWPDGGLLNGIVQFIWMAALVMIAGIPGWLLLRPFDWEEVGFIAGTIFITPIFFLSSMESEHLFSLVTKGVLKSFLTTHRYWRRFYIVSILLFLLGVLAFGSILWYVLEEVGTRQLRVIIATVLSALLFSILPTLYLRYLGRLAWIIQDSANHDAKRGGKKGPDEDDVIGFTADEEVIYIDEA